MEFTNDTYLAAIFFIPKEAENTDLAIEVLLTKAKATHIKPSPYVKSWWDCQWAGISCEAYLHNEISTHQLLVIQFLQSVFLEGISTEKKHLLLEEDGNLHIALTFRNACEALKPEVAYIATHLYYAEFEWILKNISRIESYDANRIAEEAGLLYMRGIIADCLTDPPPEYAPDTMPVKEGVLVFGGQGSKRWW